MKRVNISWLWGGLLCTAARSLHDLTEKARPARTPFGDWRTRHKLVANSARVPPTPTSAWHPSDIARWQGRALGQGPPGHTARYRVVDQSVVEGRGGVYLGEIKSWQWKPRPPVPAAGCRVPGPGVGCGMAAAGPGHAIIAWGCYLRAARWHNRHSWDCNHYNKPIDCVGQVDAGRMQQ